MPEKPAIVFSAIGKNPYSAPKAIFDCGAEAEHHDEQREKQRERNREESREDRTVRVGRVPANGR